MRSVARNVALGAFLLALGALPFGSSGCSSAELPPTPSTGTESTWQRVQIQVPDDRLHEFPEGAGLVRPIAAEDMGGEANWWIGFFPRPEIARLEERGFAVRPMDASLTEPHANNNTPCAPDQPHSVPDKFCPYSKETVSYWASCKRPIFQELVDAPTDYPPPFLFPSYVESFDFGTTHQGRKIRAVRIGKLWKNGEPPVPQMVVFAGQHAREWAGPEMVMRLVRFFAKSYVNNFSNIRTLLQKAAIVFVPVANPDGYDFTHEKLENRGWRPNREPCLQGETPGMGTDPNRNFELTWDEVGNGTYCAQEPGAFNSTFRGPKPNSAQETRALLDLLSGVGLNGKYATRLSLNVHSYGNFILFPEGLGEGPDFKFCSTDGNCTSPDHGVLNDLLGTELTSVLRDEETNEGYIVGQTFRDLYAAAGDATAAAVYGTPTRPDDARFLAASLEITNTECSFGAEVIPTSQFDQLFNRLVTAHTRLVSFLPLLNDGTFHRQYQLPHLHRRQPSGDAGEYPTLRVAARTNLGSIDILGPGMTEKDDVRDGIAYRMWRLRSSDPYVFPTEIPVCQKGKCSSTVLGDPGDGKVDLCSWDMFPDRDDGWKFYPDQPGGPQEECYWHNTGEKTGSLTSGKWSLKKMTAARLVYSVRRAKQSTEMLVYVSDNGFANCSVHPGTGCRVVRQYPFSSSHYDLRELAYRTEIIDVSDFDHASNVQVRFAVTKIGAIGIDVFDPIIVGWKD